MIDNNIQTNQLKNTKNINQNINLIISIIILILINVINSGSNFYILCLIISGVLKADMISGILHFIEDRFFDENSFLIGNIIQANRRHHTNPLDIIQYSYWRSIRTTLIFALPIVYIWYCFCTNIYMKIEWLFGTICGIHANQIHKYCHMPIDRRPKWFIFCQKIGFLNSYHHLHHRNQFNTHYCIITNILNPVLDKINFWIHLEKIIRLLEILLKN